MAMWKSILKPEHSVAVGIGIGAVDLLIFNHSLPKLADIRTANQDNTDVEVARRQATIACVGVNGLVSLMTRDWNVFLIGGAITAGMSLLVVHANAVNPQTGKMPASTPTLAGQSSAQMYPLPDYGTTPAAA